MLPVNLLNKHFNHQILLAILNFLFAWSISSKFLSHKVIHFLSIRDIFLQLLVLGTIEELWHQKVIILFFVYYLRWVEHYIVPKPSGSATQMAILHHYLVFSNQPRRETRSNIPDLVDFRTLRALKLSSLMRALSPLGRCLISLTEELLLGEGSNIALGELIRRLNLLQRIGPLVLRTPCS